MKKVLVTLLTIGVAFTSCTTDEAPAPTPTPTPIVEVDIRDAAEGIFQAELDGDTIQWEFLKNDSIQNQMIFQEAEDGFLGDKKVNIVNIVETENGFSYEVDEDVLIGTYNKTADTHIMTIQDNDEFIIVFNRIK